MMIAGIPPCASGTGTAIRLARTAERGADVALLHQLPQLDVDDDVVFEPRPDQSAMAAGVSRQSFARDRGG